MAVPAILLFLATGLLEQSAIYYFLMRIRKRKYGLPVLKIKISQPV